MNESIEKQIREAKSQLSAAIHFQEGIANAYAQDGEVNKNKHAVSLQVHCQILIPSPSGHGYSSARSCQYLQNAVRDFIIKNQEQVLGYALQRVREDVSKDIESLGKELFGHVEDLARAKRGPFSLDDEDRIRKRARQVNE